MIEAIRIGDMAAAEQLTQQHIRTFRDRVFDHFYGGDLSESVVLENGAPLTN